MFLVGILRPQSSTEHIGAEFGRRLSLFRHFLFSLLCGCDHRIQRRPFSTIRANARNTLSITHSVRVAVPCEQWFDIFCRIPTCLADGTRCANVWRCHDGRGARKER